MDDGRREVRGVKIKAGCLSRPQIVREDDDRIIIEGPIDIRLGVASARHLARVLYMMARRIEKRITVAEAETPNTAPDESPMIGKEG